MACIKYKQPCTVYHLSPFNQGQTTNNSSQNQYYMISSQHFLRPLKSISESNERNHLRESRVLISAFDQDSAMGTQQYLNEGNGQRVRISRGKSYQEKLVHSNRKIEEKMQYQLARDNLFRKNSLGIFQLPKEKRYYQSNSPHKSIKHKKVQHKGNVIQKIIDFQTKSSKMNPKIVDSAFKHYCQFPKSYENGTVSQKMAKLRSLVDQNYEQNIFEVEQFNYLNAVIAKQNDAKKQNIDIRQKQKQQARNLFVKQYSSNQVYQIIRKQYKKEDLDDFIKIGSTKNSQNIIDLKGKSIISTKKFRQAQKTPKKVMFKVKKMEKREKNRYFQSEQRLQGW